VKERSRPSNECCFAEIDSTTSPHYFGVNGGRIAEISTGQTGSNVAASPADDLRCEQTGKTLSEVFSPGLSEVGIVRRLSC
jgi:hypothetical protein